MPKKLTDLENAERHKYRVEPDGEFVPGVTTVINVLDKPALVWAASKIAAETAVAEHHRKRTIVRRHRKTLTALGPKERELAYNGSDDEVFVHYCRGAHRRIWDAKAERGTRVHDIAEQWTKNPGEPVDVRAEDAGFVDALEKFYADYSPRFIMSERIVLSPGWEYGGRFDAICETNQGTFMIDYKTGSHYESSLAMQLSAYKDCVLATYDENGRLGEFEELPELDGARGIYLSEDGSLQVIDPFDNITESRAFEAFTSCLQTYKLMKQIDKETK